MFTISVPGKLTPLSANGKQRLATFSPDGKKIAFVRDNNIFVTDLTSGTESQVTTDGRMNEIINGAADWVYEEEFGFSRAFQWSPDSRKLAFYRFDESKVKEYQLTMYGDLYPEQVKFKYPKAGEDNSGISLFIWHSDSGRIVNINIGEETDIYIPRIKWTADADILSFYRMNRHQNKLELLLTQSATGISKVIYTEENKYYIEINDNLIFLRNGEGFILTSEKDGFRHIYLYDMTGKQLNQLTSGNFEVTTIKRSSRKGRTDIFSIYGNFSA